MAITDPGLAILVLDCLEQSGVTFAVLHGESTIALGKAQSDIDIALEMDPRQALAAAIAELHRTDLHVVMIWPYDVGSASAFIATPGGEDGVQLDLVYDTDGAGRYGFRADRIVQAAGRGVRWPAATPEHELLYSIRKRLEKRQYDRLESLVDEARSRDETQLRRVIRDMFSDQSAALVEATIYEDAARPTWPRTVSRARSFSGRMVRRVRNPIGFWIAVNGSAAQESAARIEERFSRILPHSASITTSGAPFEHLCAISKARLRPAVLTSTGKVPRGLTPDIEVVIDHPAQELMAMHRIVDRMEASLAI